MVLIGILGILIENNLFSIAELQSAIEGGHVPNDRSPSLKTSFGANLLCFHIP
jgi:hypothetical protein